MTRDRKLVPLFLIFFVTVVSGCSTPSAMQSGRQGYFDRVKNSKRSVQFSKGGLFYQELNESEVPSDAKGFRWPLRKVEVTSLFGKRGKEFHEGIDLRAHLGTPVFAAQAGVVLYAGSKIRGYGKLVVVRHHQKVATIYAHNSKLLVLRGQKVKRGQQIAISGATGHVRGPHVHFEVRKGLMALNPLSILPSPSQKRQRSHLSGNQPVLTANLLQPRIE